MASTARVRRPPRRIYTLLEGRGVLEMASLPLFLPLLQATPRGDGHPVLLVPGFTAGDATLVGLRLFLQTRGYHVETWGFGQNTGFKLKFSQALEQKLRFMHHRHRRKVSVVGWSLGGVYGYYATHCAPECVRTVISLGSPMRFSVGDVKVPLVVQALYRYFAHPMGPVAQVSHVRSKVLKAPPPVPSTCIYSETDGVVVGPVQDEHRLRQYRPRPFRRDRQHQDAADAPAVDLLRTPCNTRAAASTSTG